MISRGSEWHRWEPHIHAPGTILNNQFGADSWGAYLATLEGLKPTIEAIAVTDYYITDTYEEFLKHKAAGRLPDVQLLFPNIELRLDVAAKSGFVNIHLLVSPEDPEHLVEVKRILKRLQFHAFNDRFDCTRDELIKLGKRADPATTDDGAALRHGATQFKVNFDQLRKVIDESEWAKKNILIAVAGGAGDGTSGVRQAADTTVRQEIEKFAHIIFSSSPAQREFWLGQRPGVTVEELRARYDGCKPCLHGSDSHDQKSVGQPVEDRFSWIKGTLEFDALRQACIDPEGRAYVGEQSPRSAMPSQVISHVRIDNADWAVTPDIALNPGLVAIIGARGSGKTALADVIAAGCDAISPSGWDADENISPSFLARARRLIGDATTTITWGGGADVTRSLDGRDANGNVAFPRARYLSQQFVEELCSAKGVSDGLVDEIERVIFESHSQDDREGAIDFAELRDQQTARYHQARERETEAISDISERIGTEFEKESLVATFTTQVA
ncbi:MAG: TrlF family AAA-like ATPase, partial [Phyllobacterium sp.]